MELRHVALDVTADRVATVWLDRPPVNALATDIRQELVYAFDALHARSDVHVIVLTGRGAVFCAGADIKEKRRIGQKPGTYPAVNRVIRDAYDCILDCAKPVIAAINGSAMGAGLVIAACCDLIVAADHAVFAMPEIDVGLAGGAALLQSRLPTSTLRRMLLTGDRISAAEMHRIGVLEACLPAPEVMPYALALAGRIAAKSPVATRAIKSSFAVVGNLPMREGLRFEQAMTVTLSRTEDAKEAQAAFLEKRAPKFQDR